MDHYGKPWDPICVEVSGRKNHGASLACGMDPTLIPNDPSKPWNHSNFLYPAVPLVLMR